MKRVRPDRWLLVAPAAAGVAAILLAALDSRGVFGHLRRALRRPHERQPEGARERVRRKLAAISVEVDLSVYPERLPRLPDDFDLAAFRASMPVVDPPLSRAIIEERESSQ